MLVRSLAIVLLVGNIASSAAQSLVAQGRYRQLAAATLATPSNAGDRFVFFEPAGISDHGSVVFNSYVLRSSGSYVEQMYRWENGEFSIIAESGQTALGTNAVFADLSGAHINAQGDVLFTSTLQGAGVSSANDTGIWKTKNGQREFIAREGDVVSGRTMGNQFVFDTSYFTLGDNGFLYFPEGQSGSLWRQTPANRLELVGQRGEVVPGTNPPLAFDSFIPPRVNDSGAAAFESNDVIWKILPTGETHRMAAAGDPVPEAGANAVIDFFSSSAFLHLTDTGTIYTPAVLRIGTRQRDAMLQIVDGEQVGLAMDLSILPFPERPGVSFRFFQETAFNESGAILFDAFLGGNYSPSQASGLWIYDPTVVGQFEF